MHYLTIEERERLAYAEGYTETAAVLGQIDDLQRALGEEAAMQYQLDNATDAVDGLRSKVDNLERRLTDTMAEREQARDQAKALRSALMAIEAEVPAHIRQFIREVLA
jgi:predicted  nucleic acid-binding Zn-ribbon protein